jgi:putative ABC transport system substrate-binding protein
MTACSLEHQNRTTKSDMLGAGGRMQRRKFITLLGGATASLPLVVRAQQSAMPVIGFLHAGSFDAFASHAVAFRQGVGEAGVVPGQNAVIEYRWAGGRYDRLSALAAELAAHHATVLFAGGGPIVMRAAKTVMATTPMVFTTAFDPVEAGIVTSLNRPEGNVTGVSFFGRALGPKRLELLRELLPKAATVAFLHNPKYPVRPAELANLQKAASTLGIQLRSVTASTVSEVDEAFVQLGQHRPDALLLNPDLLFLSQRELLVALAARHRIPAFYPMEEFTRAGGLISYGASTTAAYRQAGNYVGRILKGAKPAELPVLLPTKFNVAINLKTAKALGLTVADSFVLFRADEVIE